MPEYRWVKCLQYKIGFSFVEVLDFAEAEFCAAQSSSMSKRSMAAAANFVEVFRAPQAPIFDWRCGRSLLPTLTSGPEGRHWYNYFGTVALGQSHENMRASLIHGIDLPCPAISPRSGSGRIGGKRKKFLHTRLR